MLCLCLCIDCRCSFQFNTRVIWIWRLSDGKIELRPVPVFCGSPFTSFKQFVSQMSLRFKVVSVSLDFLDRFVVWSSYFHLNHWMQWFFFHYHSFPYSNEIGLDVLLIRNLMRGVSNRIKINLQNRSEIKLKLKSMSSI